jgi:hypothetical protein
MIRKSFFFVAMIGGCIYIQGVNYKLISVILAHIQLTIINYVLTGLF